MKKLFKFLSSLFKSPKKTEEAPQPKIETRMYSASLKGLTQLILPRLTEILVKENQCQIKTDKFGNPTAGYESVSDPYNSDVYLNIIIGKVFIILGNNEVAVEIEPSSMEVVVNVTIKHTDLTALEELGKLVDTFLGYVSEETTYKKLVKPNGKFKITRKQTFFGEDYVLSPLNMRTVPKVYLETTSKFLIEKFLIPAIATPGKVTALFIGPYGNGKTETSMLIGEHASEENIVMYYVDKSRDLRNILLALSNIQALDNTLVFAEDIDEVLSGSSRNSDDNQILNIIDGLESKQKNLKIILTTNHADRLNPALRRPGRIDILVPFNNPSLELLHEIFLDAFSDEGVATFCVEQVKDLNLSVAATFELIKRIKSIGTTSNEDIILCVESLMPQLRLMKSELETSPKEQFMQKLVSTFLDKNLQYLPFEHRDA